MREKDLKENLADMAFKAESDHEVQMARGDLYKIAKYAIKLHEMLKGVEEREGLDGWVQSKITKAADYIGSVYHHLDYELKFNEVVESKKKMPMGAGPDGKKGTDDDKPAFLDQKSGDKKSKGGSKPKKGVVPPQFKKKNESVINESPMVSLTIPNVTSDMASNLQKHAKENNVEYSRKGRTVVLKGQRIDMTTIRTKMRLAQSNLEMVPIDEAKDTHCSDKCCGSDVKREDCKCPPDCKHCNCNAVKESYVDLLTQRLEQKLTESKRLCNECGKTMLTASEKKELEELEEGKKHGNSKIYDKCWKGCRKVAGKKRGEPGSCKCD